MDSTSLGCVLDTLKAVRERDDPFEDYGSRPRKEQEA